MPATSLQEGPMNSTIYGADRATHIRIVVMALIAAIAVAGFAISAQLGSDPAVQAARPKVATVAAKAAPSLGHLPGSVVRWASFERPV
jgi:hypothetical protein